MECSVLSEHYNGAPYEPPRNSIDLPTTCTPDLLQLVFSAKKKISIHADCVHMMLECDISTSPGPRSSPNVFFRKLFWSANLRAVCGSVRSLHLPVSPLLASSLQNTAETANRVVGPHPGQQWSLGLDPRPSSDSTVPKNASWGALALLDASQKLPMFTKTIDSTYKLDVRLELSRVVQQFPVWALFDATRNCHIARTLVLLPVMEELKANGNFKANAQ